MKPWLRLFWQGTRFCGACLLSFCLWSVWLVLGVLLVFQIYIATTRELTLPPFVLHAFEERLAASGVRATFGRASFDPTGHVLLENVQLSLPSFTEPVLTAQSIHVRLDPWALAVGAFEPDELQAAGVSLLVPAMLSATGRNEGLVQDLNFTLIPGDHEFVVPHLTGRLATLQVSARGALHLAPMQHGRHAPLPLAELLAQNYPAICRRLIAVTRQLALLESPTVDLVLTPSESRGAMVTVNFLAQELNLKPNLPIVATRLRARTRLPLLGDRPSVVRVEASAAELRLPQDMQADNVRLVLRGRLKPAERSFDFRQIDATYRSLTVAGLLATDGAVRATPGPLPEFNSEMVTRLQGEPLALQGGINPLLRTAELHLAGRFAPSLLEPIGQRLGHDLQPFVSFGSPVDFDLRTAFAPGWKFTHVTGRVDARKVTAYHVLLDTLAGQVDFDGRHFLATDAIARLGPHFARGSFEQDFGSKEFRFLLQGRLDPPAIGGWFREWWPNFWQNFDFANAAPDANVDVHGYWGQGPLTTVFVFADCVQPVVRGVPLDHAITRIFIRPHYYDAMEVFMTRGSGAARGWFTRTLAEENYAPLHMAFDFNSTLELPGAAGLVGPEIVQVVQPFVFANSPTLRVRGFIDGPAAPTGEHREVQVEGHTTGDFSFYNFPLHNLSFSAAMRDDVLVIEPLAVGFASGVTTGKIRLAGPVAARQLGFDLGVKNANLREATGIMEKFIAERHGEPVPASSDYVERSANVRLALGISAEGLLDDPFSFTGTGNAELTGQGLGKIRLLGLLSELLNFTALRFDSLRTNFTVEKNQLVFPELNLTGNNAAVEAHGSYLLTKKELNFYARVYPFQESRFILKSVMGAMLTPLSTILEVKLGGSLDKPSWAFVIGPTNFLRSLFSPSTEGEPAPKPAATPTAPTPSGNPPQPISPAGRT